MQLSLLMSAAARQTVTREKILSRTRIIPIAMVFVSSLRPERSKYGSIGRLKSRVGKRDRRIEYEKGWISLCQLKCFGIDSDGSFHWPDIEVRGYRQPWRLMWISAVSLLLLRSNDEPENSSSSGPPIYPIGGDGRQSSDFHSIRRIVTCCGSTTRLPSTTEVPRVNFQGSLP